MKNSSSKIFTKKSKSYAQFRAGYTEAAIRKILAPYKLKDVINIADVGAGTGIGSRLMADKGAYVTAIEPNQRMIEAAAPHPKVTCQKALAERIPLDDNCVDIVTSFQAFHWFNFKKSLLEFRRILKPSGSLALIWNYWDTSDPFTAAYVNLINKASATNKERPDPYKGFSGKIKKLRMGLLWKFQYLPYFKNVERNRYKLEQEMDLNELLGLARSQSYVVHKGPSWHNLVADITLLKSNNRSSKLVYDINLFTATPVK